MTVESFDKYLGEDSQIKLNQVLNRDTFTWSWSSVYDANEDGTLKLFDNYPRDKKYELTCDPLDNRRLVHTFYHYRSWTKESLEGSPHFEGIQTFLEKLDPKSLVRVRAVLDVRKPSVVEHGFYTYYDAAPYNGLKTAILFMNTNDGYIKIEDGTKIDCLYNRLVVFPANMSYTTTSCSNQPESIFIEVNYF